MLTRFLRSLLGVTLLAALCGCYETEITIHPDHGGTYKVVHTLPAAGPFKNAEEKDKFLERQKLNYLAEGVVVTKIDLEDKDQSRTTRLEAAVKDFATYKPFKNTSFTFKETKGKTAFEMVIKQQGSKKPVPAPAKKEAEPQKAKEPAATKAEKGEDKPDPKATPGMMINGKKPEDLLKEKPIDLTIHFPAKVTETNGKVQDDGKTVAWHYTMADFYGGDLKLSATYAGVAPKK